MRYLVLLLLVFCSPAFAAEGAYGQHGGHAALAVTVTIGYGATVIWGNYEFGQNAEQDTTVVGLAVGLGVLSILATLMDEPSLAYRESDTQPLSLYLTADPKHQAPALALQYRF